MKFRDFIGVTVLYKFLYILQGECEEEDHGEDGRNMSVAVEPEWFYLR
jgi:hypothetical protein